MWPELFGPGSELGLFVAGSILAGLVAIVWFAMRSAQPLGQDPVADLWRRYEQGDLTSWEAARLFRIANQRAAAEQSAQRLALARRAEAEGTGWSPKEMATIQVADARRADYTRVPRGSPAAPANMLPRRQTGADIHAPRRTSLRHRAETALPGVPVALPGRGA